MVPYSSLNMLKVSLEKIGKITSDTKVWDNHTQVIGKGECARREKEREIQAEKIMRQRKIYFA
ncbi:MAG TPA: hypothetical protein DDW50_12535 [Firmicutes bacterium]|jgi:hypothetical protein|nr:hypothetical protein [Bacillota bacterium]